ncbi:MAG: ZIP family metal transporter [Sphingomonadaceae bacterium]
MWKAIAYGLLASSAFPIGVALGLLFDLPKRVIASVIAFGAGVLVVALTGELMAEAIEEGSVIFAIAGLVSGTIIYILIDSGLEKAAAQSPRLEGDDPQDVKPGAAAIPETRQEATVSGMAVLVGTVLDGVPENAAIGMGLAAERGPGLGLVLLGAVFLSNLPGAIASTVGMRQAGRSALYIVIAWTLVAIACIASCVAGYALLAGMASHWQSFILALAAGGILAMLSDTMFPEAFRNGGPWVALATTVGFACAFLLSRIA